MRKEIIIVIIVGAIIGAVVTLGVYTAQTAIDKQQSQPEVPTDITATPADQPQLHAITILEPENDTLTDQEEIMITGATSPDSIITIIAEDSEYLFTADSEGDFTADINLIGGANQITISSFDNLGNKAEEVLTVVYSTADL